ncbi:uncharacterized protein [Triticum aestivum]|uniref:uncharacterized protein isoform X3 n=1 Tax=Triticum aestivum TaxID=4565 RepID=UPI001D01B38F|nr:uncharacterized protein LOC123062548 isoform X3 [Triticum aestivum]
MPVPIMNGHEGSRWDLLLRLDLLGAGEARLWQPRSWRRARGIDAGENTSMVVSWAERQGDGSRPSTPPLGMGSGGQSTSPAHVRVANTFNFNCVVIRTFCVAWTTELRQRCHHLLVSVQELRSAEHLQFPFPQLEGIGASVSDPE